MANVLYEETSVQAIAEALRLKRDGSTETYIIGDMDDGILSLPMTNLPSYHVEEAKRVIQKIAELKATYPNNIVFGTISDNHVDKTNANAMTSARHAVYALETVGSAVCDFVANLGDNVVGTNIDNDIDFANATYMENVSRYAMSNLDSYNLVGNHEKSNSTQKIFDLIGHTNEFDNFGTTQIRGFGYKDYTDKKVRVIVLNTCDYWNGQGGNGMSYEQKDFFMKALDLSSKTDFASWTIIVLSHIPLDFLGGDYNKGADLKAILNAYHYGSTVSITINSSYASAQKESSRYSGTLTYNYSEKNAPKVINIHGHIHTNKYGKLKFIDTDMELDIYRIATPNSSFNGNASTNRYTEYGDYSITTQEANKIKKVANSKADTSATFYFFDLDSQTIHAIGYGADIDRTVIYKTAQTYKVTLNLTNVTASNTATVVLADSVYKNILVADSGYELKSVTVTMGGVDVTSSVYKDGVINIGMVDDVAGTGYTITGDIVITATAKDNYIPVWDIGNRTQIAISKGVNESLELNRNNYYVGASSTGAIHSSGYVSNLSVNGNDVTFTSSSKDVGIGLPYHLEAGKTYTFSATASASARLRWCYLNSNGSYANQNGYSSSGTNLSVEITAPSDASMWVMLILDTNTVNTSITYTNISLTKNEQDSGGTEEHTYYSVTNNLTNAVTSNNTTSILEGSTYNTTLSAESGYILDAVTIKMGNVDITSTSYSNGVINITNVTGDIVITATASKIASYTNVIDTAGTEDDVRLRSGGATGSAAGFASGYFPANGGDIIRVYFPNGNRGSIPSNGVYCCTYSNTNGTLVTAYDGSTSSVVLKNVTDTGYEIHIPSDVNCSYARVAGGPNGAYTDWVVTVNEPIN